MLIISVAVAYETNISPFILDNLLHDITRHYTALHGVTRSVKK